jgi:hypothetical protein
VHVLSHNLSKEKNQDIKGSRTKKEKNLRSKLILSLDQQIMKIESNSSLLPNPTPIRNLSPVKQTSTISKPKKDLTNQKHHKGTFVTN